jgi:hypothetical protein
MIGQMQLTEGNGFTVIFTGVLSDSQLPSYRYYIIGPDKISVVVAQLVRSIHFGM